MIGLLSCSDGRLLLLLESICHRYRHTCEVHKALTVHSQVFGMRNFFLHNKSIVKCKLYYNLSKICLNILACFVRNVFFFLSVSSIFLVPCVSHRLTVHSEQQREEEEKNIAKNCCVDLFRQCINVIVLAKAQRTRWDLFYETRYVMR